MKKGITTQQICITAVLMALTCIATLFFKVPIPLGYAHLGNALILLGAYLMPVPEALLIGGIGSAMADLLGGFTEWILPTLIIKCIMGGVTSYIIHAGKKRAKVLSLKTAVAVFIGCVIMVFGYFAAGSIIYGNVMTGAAQIPGLVSEDIVGIILFYLVAFAIEKSKIPLLHTI